MARRTPEEAEQTKQQLITTALTLFAERGVTNTSLKEISIQAGVTHGALYWHFRNRDDLLSQLHLLRPFPIEIIYLEYLQSARQSAGRALHDFLLAWVKLTVTDPQAEQLWRVFHLGKPDFSSNDALLHQLQEEQQRWHDLLQKLIKKARKQKALPSKSKKHPDQLADMLLLAVYGLIESQIGEYHFDRRLCDTYLSALLKGLSA